MIDTAQSIVALGLVVGAASLAAWAVLRPRLDAVETLAAAPAAGLGVLFLWGQFTDLFGVPFSTASYLVLLGALGAAAVVRTRRPAAATPAATASPRLAPVGLALLLLAMIAGTVMWAASIRGFTVPPNYDGAHHGLFVKQIDRFETVDPDRVLASGFGQPAITRFYPLAVHEAAALAFGPLSSSIPDLLFAAVVLFGAVVYPLGIYALVRALLPGSRTAPGFAALIAVLIPIFPYKPLGWGGVALIAGTALLPAAVVVLARTVSTGWDRRSAAFTTLVLLGIFGTHTSQLPLIGVVAIAVGFSWARGRQDRVDQLRRYLVIGAASLVLLLPTLPGFLTSSADRLFIDDVEATGLATAMGALLTLSVATPAGSAPVGVLALFGIAIALYRRQLMPLVWTGGLLLVLYGLTAVSRDPVTLAVSFPWYRQPERIAYHGAGFAAAFAGLALAAVADPAAAWVRRRAPGLAVVPAVAVLGVLAAVMWPVSRDGVQMVRANNLYFGSVGEREVEAFEALEGSLGPGEKVITDMNTDGSMWMYAITGLEPLFLVPPYDEPATWDEWMYLADHLASARTDPEVRRLLERYAATHVYFDQSGFGSPPVLIDLFDISLDPMFEALYDEGGVHAFRVHLPEPGDPPPTWSNDLVDDGTYDDPDLTMWGSPEEDGDSWTLQPDGDGFALRHAPASGSGLLYQMQPVNWKDSAVRLALFPTAGGEQFRVGCTIEAAGSGSMFCGLVFFDDAGDYLGQGMAGETDLATVAPGTRTQSIVTAPPGTASAVAAVSTVDGRFTMDDFSIEKRLR